MFVDVEATKQGPATQWVAESGVLDLFLIAAPAPADAVAAYARLTGATAMPQMFAIGYHQCRCARCWARVWARVRERRPRRAG